ncbi:MAG: glycosyl hydrolase family 18 protein [Putridiphycobacter sp.]
MKKVNFLKSIFTILVALIFIKNGYGQNTCKEVIGYYPSWQWYDRSKLVNPQTIQYSKYTIINYAFLYPMPDGNLTITDLWADKNLLLGNINWSVAPAGYDTGYDLGNPSYHHPNTSLIYYAHQAGTKVMISLGGWTLSDNFPSVAADSQKRTNFAHSCNQLVRLYDVDGIDIDWEYPGFVDHSGTPNDITNFSLLLQEVRDSLDAMEVVTGKSLMLTAAFSADPSKMDDIDWNTVVPILDYINLMSYDFFGAFSSETNHNSPLYAPASGDTNFNCHNAIQRLKNQYNVPANKLNLGVAFYGRSAKTVGSAGLHVPTTGATDQVTFSIDDGSPQYYNILAQMNLFTSHWDANAQVPYLTGNGSLNTFVSYDDEKSIGLKGQYIVDEELAGAIIWEITGDYLETSPGSGIIGSTPLIDTLNLSLCHAPTVIDTTGNGGGTDTTGTGGSGGTGVDSTGTDSTQVGLIEKDFKPVLFYPNPTNGVVNLFYNDQMVFDKVSVLNLSGQVIFWSVQPETKIDLSEFDPGIYFLKIESESNVYTYKIIKR